MATPVPETDLRSYRVVLATGQERVIRSAYLAEDGPLGYTFRDAHHKTAAIFPASAVREVLSLQATITASRYDETALTVLVGAALRADGASRQMSRAEVQKLGDGAALAVGLLQEAVDDFRRAHPWMQDTQY